MKQKAGEGGEGQSAVISHSFLSALSRSSAAARRHTMDMIGQDTAGGQCAPVRPNSFRLQGLSP